MYLFSCYIPCRTTLLFLAFAATVNLCTVNNLRAAEPIDAISFSVLTGLESDAQTSNPSALSLCDVALIINDSSLRPSFGLGVSALARDTLAVRGAWSAALAYQLDIIELVPFVYTRVTGNFGGNWWHRLAFGFGVERLYQSDTFISLAMGLTVTGVEERVLGFLALLGIGYHYTLDELY